MPFKAPSIRGCCGARLPVGVRCGCAKRRDKERDRARPSASQRGYDREWQVAAKAYLSEPGNQTCSCGAPATVVMHRISIRERPDLRMDRNNWRPGCTRCNVRDRWRVAQAGGRSQLSEKRS